MGEFEAGEREAFRSLAEGLARGETLMELAEWLFLLAPPVEGMFERMEELRATHSEAP